MQVSNIGRTAASSFQLIKAIGYFIMQRAGA
jgi:hypothetical protein